MVGAWDTRDQSTTGARGQAATPPAAHARAALDNPRHPHRWNRYAYVDNTPLSAVDPTGLDPCPPGTPKNIQFCATGVAYPIPPGDDNGGTPDWQWLGWFDTGTFLGPVPTGVPSGPGGVTSPGGGGGNPTSNPTSPPSQAQNTATIAAISRAACASMVANSQYSIAAHTSGDLPQNAFVQAFLGNSVSGFYDLWNAPSMGAVLEQGVNPGIPSSAPDGIDGGALGVAQDFALKGLLRNVTQLSAETAGQWLGATKLVYDGAAWGYAFVFDCSGN